MALARALNWLDRRRQLNGGLAWWADGNEDDTFVTHIANRVYVRSPAWLESSVASQGKNMGFTD